MIKFINMKKQIGKTQDLDRLERVMAQSGLSSRREAKSLIVNGKVTVNGKVILEPGYGVFANNDVIKIASNALENKESYLVYKPRGIETNKTSSKSRDLHYEFPQLKHLHPIGRLDKDSEGLIIMSNDGTLAKALTKQNSKVGKEYLVTVREQVTDKNVKDMASGIVLDGVITKPAVVKKISQHTFTILLHEGRKHQIRRMSDACRLTIEKLVRVKIGHLNINSIKQSSTKLLSKEDVNLLKD